MACILHVLGLSMHLSNFIASEPQPEKVSSNSAWVRGVTHGWPEGRGRSPHRTDLSHANATILS